MMKVGERDRQQHFLTLHDQRQIRNTSEDADEVIISYRWLVSQQLPW